MMSNDNKESPEKGETSETTVNGKNEQQDAPTDVDHATHILMSLQNADYDADPVNGPTKEEEFHDAENGDATTTTSEAAQEEQPADEESPKSKDSEVSLLSSDQKESVETNDEDDTTKTSTYNPKQSDKSSSNALPTDTRRRVKLYMLNQNRTWDDRGTGHVTSTYVEHLEGVSLLVKAESDGSLLLESKILPDTAYQKQQDTLIVWSEGENYDLALSFQERVGCEEIWAKICQVQGKDPTLDATQEMPEDDESDLPPCEVERLDEINSIICSCLTMQGKKENISIAIESENYIPKLLEMFSVLEKKKDIVALQKLFDVIKNIFLLNQNSLLEILVSEECIWDVFGVLEYDPNGAAVREVNAKKNHSHRKGASPTKEETKTHKTHKSDSASNVASLSEADLMRLVREKRHREFLSKVSKFKEIVPREKKELVSKIHQTYRVQYIQDVILPSPSVFEDNMLSTLSSFIFFSKVDIVQIIQQDRKFLQEIFRQLADETPSFSGKRRDLVMFFKELCTFSHTLQLQNREGFIKTLQHLGLLDTIQLLLKSKDTVIKNGAVDILNYCVDYSPSMIREFVISQGGETPLDAPENQDVYLINVIIKQMIIDTDPDLGMTTQLANILKILLDPENMLNNDSFNKSEKMDFLNFFYKYCLYHLLQPIEQMVYLKSRTECLTAEDEKIIERRLAVEQTCQSAQLLAIILDLFTFCVEHHGLHIRNYILVHSILQTVVRLLHSRHTFLVLAVIRFIRRVINLKDEFYYRRIVSFDIFRPIVQIFMNNGGRYNLLDSAVNDLFEFIRINNIQYLINYIVEKLWKDQLEQVEYVKTFKLMKTLYDQHKQLREKVEINSYILSRTNRFRRDRRDLEKEEETWFRDVDDDEESMDDDDEEADEIDIFTEKSSTLRLPSRIKSKNPLLQESSESSINSIFTSTFKVKSEERKMKINITSKSLSSDNDVKVHSSESTDCDQTPETSKETAMSSGVVDSCDSLKSSTSKNNDSELPKKSSLNADSTCVAKTLIDEQVLESKTSVDSTQKSKSPTKKDAVESTNKENHINLNHGSKVDSTVEKANTNGTHLSPNSIDDHEEDELEFVSSSSFIGDTISANNDSTHSPSKRVKRSKVSSSSSKNSSKRKHDDIEASGSTVSESESNSTSISTSKESTTTTTTTDSKLANSNGGNKRICISVSSEAEAEGQCEPTTDQFQATESDLSQSF